MKTAEMDGFAVHNELFTWEGWRELPDPDDDAMLSYGGFSNPPMAWRELDPAELYILPRFMGGSDYSGSTVERSNHRCFLEDHEGARGVFDVYGGHGTFAIAIRADCLTPDMYDTLRGLDDYPLISEDDLSEVEREAEGEAWECWARSDFISAVEKHLDLELDLEDRAALALFNTAQERENEYWIFEEGGTAWIDLDRIAAAVELADIPAGAIAEETA